MLYELRIYTAHEGKLEALSDRFRDYTLGLFKKRGMNVHEFWLDGEGRPKLYYVLEFQDMEERARKWTEFRQDPAWSEVLRKTEQDGVIVAKIEEIVMKRADYFR